MTDEILKSLQDRVSKLEKKPKDIWDKISSLSTLISGIVIAALGFLFTNYLSARQSSIEEKRSRETSFRDSLEHIEQIRLQKIELSHKFFPFLSEKRTRQPALFVISLLDTTYSFAEISLKLGEMYKDTGALIAISKAATYNTKLKAEKYIARLDSSAAKRMQTEKSTTIKTAVIDFYTGDDDREGGIVTIKLFQNNVVIWTKQFEEYPYWSLVSHNYWILEDLDIPINLKAMRCEISLCNGNTRNISWDVTPVVRFTTSDGGDIIFGSSNFFALNNSGNKGPCDRRDLERLK